MSQLSDVESPSLAETKEVVEKHRRVLAERKAALKKAEADLKKDLKKMSHGLKETTGDTSAIEDIQASLREVRKRMCLCGLVGWVVGLVLASIHSNITTPLLTATNSSLSSLSSLSPVPCDLCRKQNQFVKLKDTYRHSINFFY